MRIFVRRNRKVRGMIVRGIKSISWKCIPLTSPMVDRFNARFFRGGMLTLLFALLTSSAMAADKPYDEKADAKVQIKQALTEAATNHMPIILVFGANWCPDCLVLDLAMKKGASASLLARDFRIVKIDVGQKDKNLEVAHSYGVPVTNGIPAVAIISARNEVLYATKEGELSNAQKMGEAGIYEFFKRVTEEARGKKL